MATDVELNEVKAPLIGHKDPSIVPEVAYKSPKQDLDDHKSDNEFRGLTKDELEKFANDPFWKKLRLILFILFWIVWVGMLIGAILIVIFSPKCGRRPKLQFWEQKTGYWVDPFAFVDTDSNGVGDFEGIKSKLDYIQKDLGAGYIILDSVFKGQYNSTTNKIGLVETFREVEPMAGNQKSLLELIKEARKRGIEIVMTADFNSLSTNSPLLRSDLDKWLIPYEGVTHDKWVNREGKKSIANKNGKDYYSVLPDKLDLNLQNEVVLKEIRESVKFWLENGIRGFLLTNVPFYVENSTVTSTDFDSNSTNLWYKSRSINGQIYSKETLNFLKEIRRTLDEVAKRTDKPRLLIVDAGDVGFGLERHDDLIQYLGNKDEKVADMVISREFVVNRGWKITGVDKSLLKSSVKNYEKIPSELRKKLGLTSATSTNQRSTVLFQMAAPFLLQGNSIIYYGSELGLGCDPTVPDIKFYPQNKQFPTYGAGEESSRCNHMIMPWDNSGDGFNNLQTRKYNYKTQSTVTVQRLTAIGYGESILQLHRNLITIRKEPSLLWGDVELISNDQMSNSSFEIVIRRAAGFPAIIVALSKISTKSNEVVSFKSICEKVTPILVYPSNSNLEINKKIESNNIFLQIPDNGSVHVFMCS